MVTVMTVEPGKGGQDLIVETIDKIKELKQYIENNEIDIDIEADGGINTENVSTLKEAGANIIVSGTAIVKSENFSETIGKMKE